MTILSYVFFEPWHDSMVSASSWDILKPLISTAWRDHFFSSIHFHQITWKWLIYLLHLTCNFHAQLLNFRTRVLSLRRKKHKIGNTGTHNGFFGPMNFRKKKKLSTFMNWAAVNVTSAWTWMNFYRVIRTEDVMEITFTYLYVNVCKFVHCNASWKLESFVAQ